MVQLGKTSARMINCDTSDANRVTIAPPAEKACTPAPASLPHLSGHEIRADRGGGLGEQLFMPLEHRAARTSASTHAGLASATGRVPQFAKRGSRRAPFRTRPDRRGLARAELAQDDRNVCLCACRKRSAGPSRLDPSGSEHGAPEALTSGSVAIAGDRPRTPVARSGRPTRRPWRRAVTAPLHQ
jgi:hypothetical protein